MQYNNQEIQFTQYLFEKGFFLDQKAVIAEEIFLKYKKTIAVKLPVVYSDIQIILIGKNLA